MSAGLVGLIGLGLLIVAVVVTILVGTGGWPNRWPGLGTNASMQPGFGMTWWKRQWPGSRPSTSVPDAEEALGPHYDIRTLNHRLDEELHPRHQHTAASWMDDPGALERGGLVDAPRRNGPHPVPGHAGDRDRHRRGRHSGGRAG